MIGCLGPSSPSFPLPWVNPMPYLKQQVKRRLGRLRVRPCLGAQVTEESDKAEALKAFKRKLEERPKDLSKA